MNALSRPGISPAALTASGVRHVEAEEARRLIGFSASGVLIPYFSREAVPHLVNGKQFARLRLDDPTTSAKYLSPPDSGCQLYEPPGLSALLSPGCIIAVTEGEFKALSLVEAGFACVGIGGISSACPRDKTTGEPALIPALAALVRDVRPSKIAFVGDADTVLLYEFSREAAKLAKLCSVPILLPRIPLDAPGKGPDDLREIWGDEFPSLWRGILDASESVTTNTKPGALVVRLLRRETAALARLDGDALDMARERIVRLYVGLGDETLARADVESIATECLRLTKKVFALAVKSYSEAAKRESAERMKETALAALSATGENPLYFDGSGYWRREANDAFGKLCREDARLHLNRLGLSKNGDPSPCDAALHSLQTQNRVDLAGPLCGRRAGLHLENGLRVLVTHSPTWVTGTSGDSPTITALIANLLGRAAGDEYAPIQAAIFASWLKYARQAMRRPDLHLPGQVLALVGPPDCGKSLLQSLVISPALGGRSADPGLFFTGQTNFNSDLWGAEHLALGDKGLDVEGAQRTTLRNELKRAVAENVYPLHAKHRDGFTFRPVWRISISANSDPESASNLPALDASFADKVIYLRCYAPPSPFYNTESAGAREAFASKLRDELPAFLGAVDAFEIPPDFRKARFGVTEWHHPEIRTLLDEGDPLESISEILRKWLDSWPPGEDTRELPTVELYRSLNDANDGDLARHKISTGPKHLGHQLAKLAEKPEWCGTLKRSEFRIGGRISNRLQRGWRISR